MTETYEGKTDQEWIENGKKPGVCKRCYGCKSIATDDDQSAWWVWATLPTQSQLAIHMGLVQRKTCPDCNGTGTA